MPKDLSKQMFENINNKFNTVSSPENKSDVKKNEPEKKVVASGRENKNIEVFTTRMDKNYFQAIKLYASKNGMSANTLIVLALETYFKDNEQFDKILKALENL